MKIFLNIIVIKLLLLMTNTMLGQEMEIMLGKNDFVKVQILDYERFEKIKETDSLSRIPTVKRYAVSRTFKSKKEEIFIEFFNRAVVQVKNESDLERLKNVHFDAHINWKLRVPIFSIVYIEENIFNELKEEAKLIEDVGELSQIAEFYQLSNGFVILKWVDTYSNLNKYSIIEDVKNANGLDLEFYYEGFFKEGELDEPAIKSFKKKKIVFDENFDKELWDGGKENLDKLINLLSESLNVDKNELDFSEKSFDKLDESLHWNYNSPYELVNPLSAYVGLALTRNHQEIKWDIEGYLIGLKSEKGEVTDLVGEVASYLIDTDYGWPQIKPVMQNIQRELTK
ncbi:MAG: hypothetical protein AB8H03_20565 [Saprospiraceae bacterium]